MKTANVQTKAQSKAKQSVKQGNSVAKQDNQAPKQSPKFTYLIEGISGKQLNAAKIETNANVKSERKGFSYNLKAVIRNDANFISSFAQFKGMNSAEISTKLERECTPKSLAPFLKEGKKGKEGDKGFSAWLVMTLIKRFYSKK